MVKYAAVIAALASSATLVAADTAGYILPSSGTASTTQFLLGPEMVAGGTACGVVELPNGDTSLPDGAIGQGDGPGYLYVSSGHTPGYAYLI